MSHHITPLGVGPSYTMLWFSVTCCLLVLLVTRVLWRRWKYDLHKIPSPPGLPVLEHTLEFLCGDAGKKLLQWIAKSRAQLNYPKLMRFTTAGETWLVPADHHFNKTVVLSPIAPFPRAVESAAFLAPTSGNDPHVTTLLLSALVSPHVKAIRKLYSVGFQSSNLKLAMPKLHGVLDRTVSTIESKRVHGPVNVQELFVRMTLDAIGVVAFDTNLGGLDGSRQIYELLLGTGHIARRRLFNPALAPFCKIFPGSQEAQRQNATINAMTQEWTRLTDEILNREDPSSGEEPMWYGLKHLKDSETGKPAAYKSLLSEVAGVVLAGMETTGHQLGWIFALLASHPEAVSKIMEELKMHGLDSREAEFDELAELTYLTAVIKECVRLSDITSTHFPRKVPKDMTILGYRVPGGTKIMLPGNRAFNTEAEWGDPKNFRPERWFAGEDLSHKWNIMFSTGPRDCVGQKFAMLEIRTTIIKLIQTYSFELVGSYDELAKKAMIHLVVEAEGGIWLSMKPRNDSLTQSL